MGRGSFFSARVDEDLREHVAAIEAALADRGPLDRGELWDAVDGGTWEAGVFGHALSEAAVKGVIERAERNKFALAEPDFALESGSPAVGRRARDTSRTVR